MIKLNKFLSFVLVVFFSSSALGITHYSTINSFAPATRQDHFTVLEEGTTLEKKKFNLYLFLDAPYKSLSVYDEREGEDLLTFVHMGLSYGITSRLEFGFRGQGIFGEFNNDDQLSMQLNESGFSHYDAFLKYSVLQNSKFQAALKANIGSVSGTNIFFEGPNSGLNFSLDLDISASISKWMLAVNVGYLKRTPGDRDPAFAFFEPIESSIIFNAGISRDLNEKTNVRLEVFNALHDFTLDQSDRTDFSSEAMLSLHRQINKFRLTAGASIGLTDGISVPTARGVLGIGYRFGFKAREKSEEPIEEVAVFEEEPVEEYVEEVVIEEEPYEDEPYEEIIEEAVEESVVIEDEQIEELIEEPVYVEEEVFVEESVPVAPVEDQKFILNNIEFAFDSYELDDKSKSLLEEFYNYLQTNNYNKIEIWGHTDFIGTLEYNEYLGLSRAKAVHDYLARLGVSVGEMKYDSFGERRPVNTGLSNDFRRKNRRVEILLIK